MENFDRPYAARSFREFWRRWHISLSTWFRDYVYVPLGGSRRGPARERANVVATMLLSGLWHGAAWTFLLWGAMHAALMVLESVTRGFWRRAPAALARPLVWVARVPGLGSLPGRRLRLGARVLPRSRTGGLGPALARLPVRGGRRGRGGPRPRPARGAGSSPHGPRRRLGVRPGRALGRRLASSSPSSRTSSGAPLRRRSSTSGSDSSPIRGARERPGLEWLGLRCPASSPEEHDRTEGHHTQARQPPREALPHRPVLGEGVRGSGSPGHIGSDPQGRAQDGRLVVARSQRLEAHAQEVDACAVELSPEPAALLVSERGAVVRDQELVR